MNQSGSRRIYATNQYHKTQGWILSSDLNQTQTKDDPGGGDEIENEVVLESLIRNKRF